MRRFLIAFAHWFKPHVGNIPFQLKADARPTTQSIAAAVAQSTAQVVPAQNHLI